MPKQQPSEAQHQMAVIKWTQQPSIRSKYPELKLLHHIPNGGTRGKGKDNGEDNGEDKDAAKREGQLLKLQGVKKGVPDLCLPVARGRYHGLYIELKVEKGGKVSSEQEWWGEALAEQGYYWEVCHGWESAVRALEWYLNLKEPR